MIEMGLLVCAGLMMWFFKASWKVRMWLLSRPLVVDLGVFTFLTAIHWGTFSGVMAATVGAFMASILLSCGRKVYGYIDGSKYYRGYIDVYSQLTRVKA